MEEGSVYGVRGQGLELCGKGELSACTFIISSAQEGREKEMKEERREAEECMCKGLQFPCKLSYLLQLRRQEWSRVFRVNVCDIMIYYKKYVFGF